MLTCAPEKAMFGGGGQSTKKDKIQLSNIHGKLRKSVKAEVRPSCSAGDFSVQPYFFVVAYVCPGGT